MDFIFTSFVLSFFFTITYAAACTAIGAYVVKNKRRSAAITGNVLYIFYFLDGFEAILNRTASSVTLVKTLLECKLVQSDFMSKFKAAPAPAPQRPPSPTPATEDAPVRRRARITPPETSSSSVN